MEDIKTTMENIKTTMKDIETTMEEPKFTIRCYNKVDLATIYFKTLTPNVAVAKLRRWMRNCSDLMDEIDSGDFHPKSKMYTAREVRLIVRHLGEPD